MADYTEKKCSSETIFEGKIITVTVDGVELVNGKSAQREVVHHGGGSAMVALNEKGEVALVRQFRYAVGETLIEIPAGKIESGEDPRNTAIRELGEEAGLQAEHVCDFGCVLPTCAYCTERIYIYIATGLTPVARNLDEDEFVDVFWMPLNEAVGLVMDGEISDAKTVSALLRAKLALDSGAVTL